MAKCLLGAGERNPPWLGIPLSSIIGQELGTSRPGASQGGDRTEQTAQGHKKCVHSEVETCWRLDNWAGPGLSKHSSTPGLAPPGSLPALTPSPALSPSPPWNDLGSSWQQGSTAAAKLSKRFILRFMQNSLCGARGGPRFNIHADLEEMVITGLGNLHSCLDLLPGWAGQPRPLAPPSCGLDSSQSARAAG